MAKYDKAKASFASCRKEFPWPQFESMILGMGFARIGISQSGGSRRKYLKDKTLLMLDEPHDGVMGRGMVRRLQSDLKDAGLL